MAGRKYYYIARKEQTGEFIICYDFKEGEEKKPKQMTEDDVKTLVEIYEKSGRRQGVDFMVLRPVKLPKTGRRIKR